MILHQELCCDRCSGSEPEPDLVKVIRGKERRAEAAVVTEKLAGRIPGAGISDPYMVPAEDTVK